MQEGADQADRFAKPVSAEEVGDIVANAVTQNFVKATNQRDAVMRDTLKHCREVGYRLGEVIAELYARSIDHDLSKFDPSEFDAFVEATPKLKSSVYGSEEYNRTLQDIAPALKHHYANNSHHPEFHRSGILDMSLIDLIEMLCDWKAATARHSDGSLARSFEVNRDRFGIPSELYAILMNTAKQLDWIE